MRQFHAVSAHCAATAAETAAETAAASLKLFSFLYNYESPA